MDINSIYASYINLPMQFIVLVLSFLYLKRVRITMKELLLCLIFIFIPSVTLYFFIYWLGIIYFIITLILFFTWSTKDKSTVFYIGAILIVAIIMDHFATILVSFIFFKQTIAQIICRAFIFTIFLFLSVSIIRYINDTYLKKFNVSSKIQRLLNIIIMLTILIFYFNIFRIFKNPSIEALRVNTFIFILYLFLMVILLITIFYIFIKEEKLKAREKEYENFNSYIYSLEQVNKDMQKFRHDYLNILLSMKGYIDEQDWLGLEQYFEKGILNVERKTLMNASIIGNLDYLHDKSLKGLLFNKSSRALELGINISIEIQQPVRHISFDRIDLNRIIGVFFDNAIENCIEDEKKEIQIAILHKENESTLITIRNQISSQEIDVNKIYEEGYTTKSNNTGIGLATVNQIIDKNSQAFLNTWIKDKWFCIEFIILEG